MSVSDAVGAQRAETPARSRARLALTPWVVVAAVVLAAFAVAASFARSIHTFSVMPDELGYVKQAITIAHTGWLVHPHDFYFNSWAQLLPVISAPLFGPMSVASAYDVAHVLYPLILASAAIPAYLLGRELRLPPLGRYALTLSSVAVPWLVFSALMMTEVVAYPAFLWTVLAVLRGAVAPSSRRDAVALLAATVAFFARTQFVVFPLILVLVVWMHHLTFDTAGVTSRRKRLRLGTVRAVRSHPLLASVTALAVLVVVLTGGGGSALGNYATPLHGTLLPAGTLRAGLEQFAAIVLAVGIAPAALALAWALPASVGRSDPERRAFAVILLLLVALLIVMLGAFQQRVLDGKTTDRYMFYLAPLLFAGALVWVDDRRRRTVAVTVAVGMGVALGALVGLTSLHADGASIINDSFGIHTVLAGRGRVLLDSIGLSSVAPQVLVALAGFALTAIALLVRGRVRRPVATLAAVVVPALAFSMVSTGYEMVKLHASYAGLSADHPREVEWIDRALPPGSRAAALISYVDSESTSEFEWWGVSFWNKVVTQAVYLPDTPTLSQGFLRPLVINPATGAVSGLGDAQYLIHSATQNRLGFRWPVAARSGSLEVLRRQPGPALSYLVTGVNDAGQMIGSRQDVALFDVPSGRSEVTVRLKLTFAGAVCPCRLRLSGHPRPWQLVTRGPVTLAIDISRRVAGPGVRRLSFALTDRHGRPVGAVGDLLAVTVGASARGGVATRDVVQSRQF